MRFFVRFVQICRISERRFEMHKKNKLNDSTDGNHTNTDDLWLIMNRLCPISWDEFAYIEDDDDFSSLKLAVFVGCQTANEGSDGSSFAEAVYNSGAEVTIGFTQDIDCSAANGWIETFYIKLLQGDSVEEVVDYLTVRASEQSGLKSCVIYSTQAYTLEQLLGL